jgi:D-inositol-3-phosphate glycosyltransferase
MGGERSRRALGISASRVILFVGRLETIKGLDVLLRSMAELAPQLARGARLGVVGDTPAHARRTTADYRRLTARLGIDQLVEFRGQVSRQELPLYYSAADVLAAPSAYESFGMAAVEAMACGTPVVAFRVGGLATTIRDGKTGFLATPGVSRDFTDKLRMALESDELDSMGRQARLVAQGYTWDAIADRTLALYDDLIGQRYVLESISTAS